MMAVQHISTYIHRSPGDVYAFASSPANLPKWAAGLAGSEVTREDGQWRATAPFGRVSIRFAKDNTFGVMDHDVELDDGSVFHNPMRVVANEQGSEFTFTLFRQPEMTDEQFAADREAVEADLATLKTLLESQPDER
ncbi:SRPBCC family protein [Halomonas cupida]|uniref:hypothetical protein n=1 Tax=Halomonas cupida TaxID=44933 RepID=UPI0039B4ECBA